MSKNIDIFFNPESIAVIGASRTPGKIGYTILENLKLSFKGKIYPINPNTTEIMGFNCYPSVLEIKEPIDMAIIVTPAEMVNKLTLECIKKRIKACVIISSGFSEIGEKERELELKKISKGKIRILGPNCLGIYQKNMDMLFLPIERLKRPSEGSIVFITQSGAVGSAILDLISNEGVGIAKFISIGNNIDVNEIELLEFIEKDVQTRCIALYIESTKSGKDLISVCKKIVKKKPIVAYKAGKTKKGMEAVLSHTGALTGQAELYKAAFKQAGIIEADSIEEIFDFSKALSSQPILNDNKIGIITDGGGFGIIAADSALENGLEVPEISKESEKALKSFLPKHAIIGNPIDLTGDVTVERYQKALDVLFKDKSISGVVVIVLFQVPLINESLVEVLRDCKMHGKPFVVCACGGAYTQNLSRKLESFGIPVYTTPERAVRAIWSLYEYGKILKRK